MKYLTAIENPASVNKAVISLLFFITCRSLDAGNGTALGTNRARSETAPILIRPGLVGRLEKSW